MKTDFSKMSLDELETHVQAAQAELDNRREARRQELIAELEKLGGLPNGAAKKPERKARTPRPKYRSFRDPEKTWSGRGRIAGWLKQEMEETGKPLEDFLIRD